MIWALAMADFQQFIIHICEHGLNLGGLQWTVTGKTIEDNKTWKRKPKNDHFQNDHIYIWNL